MHKLTLDSQTTAIGTKYPKNSQIATIIRKVDGIPSKYLEVVQFDHIDLFVNRVSGFSEIKLDLGHNPTHAKRHSLFFFLYL